MTFLKNTSLRIITPANVANVDAFLFCFIFLKPSPLSSRFRSLSSGPLTHGFGLSQIVGRALQQEHSYRNTVLFIPHLHTAPYAAIPLIEPVTFSF